MNHEPVHHSLPPPAVFPTPTALSSLLPIPHHFLLLVIASSVQVNGHAYQCDKQDDRWGSRAANVVQKSLQYLPKPHDHDASALERIL